MTIDYLAKRPMASLDSECYVNYWSLEFRDIESDRKRLFELYDGQPLDRAGIIKMLRNWRVYGFNSLGYDFPMIALAMTGASNALLKQASDDIIEGGLRHWQFEERYGITVPPFLDHIDLQQVSPGAPTMPSLKMYAGRLHSRRMQDLPIKPDERILPAMRPVMRSYLSNDTQVTKEMALELKAQLDLRAVMSVEYGIDLRSKSDAQIAEAVIRSEVEKLRGRRVYKPDISPGTFRYIPPPWVNFETEQMQDVFTAVLNANFLVRPDGQVLMPKALEDMLIHLGESAYQMGIGGLHSTEESRAHKSDDNFVLLDRDVTSYYPALIINNRFIPKHMGQAFLQAYENIFRRRLAAKAAGKVDTAESLKIVLNGSFGKFGSPFSVLYSPNLMIQTTVSGQLAILMLIEAMELRGISVVSANTDGFVSRVPRDRRDVFEAVVTQWEWDTGLGTEETEYLALYSRDVNNYIAFPAPTKKDPSPKPKRKGAYAQSGPGLKGAAGLKKNPDVDICSEAVVAFLQDGTPFENTIQACTDIRKFVVIRRVTGGGQKDGAYLGKVVRWYYGYGEQGHITSLGTGNNVASSGGAVPCMELPDELPDDIDYDWYVRECHAMLDDLGVGGSRKWGAVPGRTGIVLAHLPDQVTVHQVDIAEGVAACGYTVKNARMRWVEPDPDHTMRHCTKCRKAGLL